MQSAGTRCDYVEIAEPSGRARRLRDALVPERLQRNIAPAAIGECHCLEAGPGISPAYQMIDFRRVDRPAT